MAALAEKGDLHAARQDGALVLQMIPTSSAAQFRDYFAGSAVELQRRYMNAALAAGIPAAPEEPGKNAVATK